MFPLIGLAGIAVAFYLISAYLTRRREKKLAAEWGCQPLYFRPSRWPLGFDHAWGLIKADRTNDLPNHIEDIYKEVGLNTWEQCTAGTTFINTNEPKNVQVASRLPRQDHELTRPGSACYPVSGLQPRNYSARMLRAGLRPGNIYG